MPICLWIISIRLQNGLNIILGPDCGDRLRPTLAGIPATRTAVRFHPSDPEQKGAWWPSRFCGDQVETQTVFGLFLVWL
jgi:hypothetical protein